jgi:TonB family protein
MMSSLRNLLLVAVLVGLLHSNALAGDKPPPGTYVEVEIEYETGVVIDAHLSKSTGDPLLDKATLDKFRKWRFKPKKVRRLKIPIILPPSSVKDQKASRRSHLPGLHLTNR